MSKIVDKIMMETLGAIGPFELNVNHTGAIEIKLDSGTLYATPAWEESASSHTLLWERYNESGHRTAHGSTPFNYNLSDNEIIAEWTDRVIEMAYAFN